MLELLLYLAMAAGVVVGIRNAVKGVKPGRDPLTDYLFGRGPNPRRSRDPYSRPRPYRRKQ